MSFNVLTLHFCNVILSKKNRGIFMENNSYLFNLVDNLIIIAKKSGDIFKNAHAENIDKKTNFHDLVTEYDKAVQDYIFNQLSSLYPDVLLVGEESEDLASYNADKVKAFIIDPIDGTSNFINELSHSCVSIAYAEYGKVVAGVVYNPYKDHLYSAIKGNGAYFNGIKMQVNDTPISQGLVGFGTAVYYDELIEETKRIFGEALIKCNDLRRMGSAAIDLSLVSTGSFAGFFETRLCPWDYAATLLFIEEAGGIITDFNGNNLPLNKKSSVIAGNKIAYKELFDIINKKN